MSTNVTMRHLRAFVSVARSMSFTRAAEELHLSQPALTLAIRQLESIVGSTLFDRTTRRILLTGEGGDFLPTAERLLHDFDLAIEDIRIVGTRRRARVRIASVNSVAANLLPPAILEFSRAYPTISIYLRDGNSTEVRNRVRRNEVDLGYGSIFTPDTELDCTPFFRDRMGLLARADHPLLRLKRPLIWSDLGGYDFLSPALDTGTRPVLETIPGLPSSVTSPRYEFATNSTMEAMLEAGIGITMVPASQVPTFLGHLLKFRPLEEPAVWRTVHLMIRRGRSLSPAALRLAAMVKEQLTLACKRNPLIEALGGREPQPIRSETLGSPA